MSDTYRDTHEARVLPLLFLPSFGDEPGAFMPHTQLEKPCTDEVNKVWMTPAFMTLHTDSMKRIYYPCLVCGYQTAPVFIDTDETQWMPDEFSTRAQRYKSFNVSSMDIDRKAGRLTRVYIGGVSE